MRDGENETPPPRNREDLEQQALAALHVLRHDRAPDALRMRIELIRAAGGRVEPGRRLFADRRRAAVRALAGAAGAAFAAIILLLPGGAPGAPSVSEAAAIAAGGPVLAAPAPDPDSPTVRLQQRVGAIYFPNWQREGWRAVGRRIDRMGKRTMVTVFYRRGRASVAYTIVGTPALAWPRAHRMNVAGTRFEALSVGRRLLVTWRRSGHTCVLSATGTSAQALARLALHGY